MENNYAGLDIEALKNLYEKESGVLHTKLLEGTPWTELKEQRKKVTKLAITLHKRISNANPAESSGDGTER